jgi:galacturan 1,4-alpha-galacturonidase
LDCMPLLPTVQIIPLTHPQFSDSLAHWRQPSSTYPITFQNHRASFILSGSRIQISGHSTGGINGNGNVWYDDEKAKTREGRPMPFVLWNITKSSVKKFFVRDPPLWGVNVMNGTDMVFEDLVVNATAVKAPRGKNWVQNTDGFGEFCSSLYSCLSASYLSYKVY